MVELTTAHLDLARKQVSIRIRNVGLARLRDEWESAAMEALVLAARSFDPDRGVPFEAWAVLRIKTALIDAHRAWFGRHHPKPEAGHHAINELFDFDTEAPSVDDVEATIIARDELRHVAELRPREREALMARTSGRPYAEIAEAWGVTESRVSQLASAGSDHLAQLLEAA